MTINFIFQIQARVYTIKRNEKQGIIITQIRDIYSNKNKFKIEMKEEKMKEIQRRKETKRQRKLTNEGK